MLAAAAQWLKRRLRAVVPMLFTHAFVVAVAFVAITRRLPVSGAAISMLRVRYQDGHGILRDVALADLPHVEAIVADDVNAAAELTSLA